MSHGCWHRGAGDEAPEGLLLDRALEATSGAQFCRVSGDALVKRARARIARPVDPAAWRNAVATSHSPRNARCKASRASSAEQEDMANNGVNGEW